MSENPSIACYDLLLDSLQDARDAWESVPTLAVGEVVCWKRGFQQNELLEPEGLAIVMALSLTSRPDEHDWPGAGYALHPDVELGVLDADNCLGLFRTERRYLASADEKCGRVARRLREAHAAWMTSAVLEIGQLVSWKPGCAMAGPRQRALPALLLELLDAPRIPDAPVRTPFRQAVDAAVAIEDGSCGFRVFWTDRRRLAPYRGGVASAAARGAPVRRSADTLPPPAADAAAEVAARLLERHRRMSVPQALRPGMLVRWKAGLRNRSVPLDDDVAIVMEVPDTPHEDPLTPVGDPGWRQPLSVALGCMGEDGPYLIGHYDARRFEPLGRRRAAHGAFLRRRATALQRRHTFQPGQLVAWKPGLKNRTAPSPDGMAIVLEVLDPPLPADRVDGASPYFREPLSLIVGIREDDVLLTLHVDGRRFQPLTMDEADAGEVAWLSRRRDALTAPATPLPPGTLVAWKTGLGNLADVPEDCRGIVLAVCAPPVFAAEQSAGSALYRVPHTLEVGFLDEAGLLRTRYVEGRRMRRAQVSDEDDARLIALREALQRAHAFVPGDIVVWERGLQAGMFLNLSEESPGIVIEVLETPVPSPCKEFGAEDFRAHADLLVGGFDVEGDFAIVHADRRRLAAHPAPHGDAARTLRGFRRRFACATPLRPGMLVAWKDRFCNQIALPHGIPAIVLATHDRPHFANAESLPLASPSFRLPWDTVIGIWWQNRFQRVCCDRRRLEAFDAAAQSEIRCRRQREEVRRMADFSRMLEEQDDDDLPL